MSVLTTMIMMLSVTNKFTENYVLSELRVDVKFDVCNV